MHSDTLPPVMSLHGEVAVALPKTCKHTVMRTIHRVALENDRAGKCILVPLESLY